MQYVTHFNLLPTLVSKRKTQSTADTIAQRTQAVKLY